MEETKLSPAQIIAQRQKAAKSLTTSVYTDVFDLGVEETAAKFCIKPEEVVKLVCKSVVKNGDLSRFVGLLDKAKFDKIKGKIWAINSISEPKLIENCKSFAKKWEIVAARFIFKQNLRLERQDNE